jgi:hypothetical protein
VFYFDPNQALGSGWDRQNVSVSGASMSQTGPALFHEPESFKKVQFQAQDICLILELEVKC